MVNAVRSDEIGSGGDGMFDEDAVRPLRKAAVGDDLSGMSIEDLEERIAALRAEIERVEGVLSSKRAGRAAAEAVFGGQ
jgi:uncharacterized small protein (DUF1192 family)